jgi:hypothetical protein
MSDIANKLAPFEDLSQEADFYAGEIGLHQPSATRPLLERISISDIHPEIST